jgi:predicted nucleotidyltransferase
VCSGDRTDRATSSAAVRALSPLRREPARPVRFRRTGFDAATSDLDFLVEFENFIVDGAADRFLGFLIDLEDLFGRKVDLVYDTSIRNPYFRQVVDRTRVPLYAA